MNYFRHLNNFYVTSILELLENTFNLWKILILAYHVNKYVNLGDDVLIFFKYYDMFYKILLYMVCLMLVINHFIAYIFIYSTQIVEIIHRY